MEINLESDVELASSFKAIYNVLRATMEYPAGAQAKAKKLADDIAFFVSSAPGDPPFWEICPIIIELASRLPPDHKWQASLVQSIHILSELDKSPLRGSNLLPSGELPDFVNTISEYWEGFNNPAGWEDYYPETMEIWKNVNSFLAKISSAELTPCLCYGFDQIQQALEKPPPDGGYEGPWAASMLWIASEWIEQCGSLIFTMMDHKKDHALSREVPTDVDSLYKNLPPHSIERWTFWKSQLLRIATDPDTTHKMQAAVGVMSEAEKGAKNGAENDDKENTEVLQG